MSKTVWIVIAVIVVAGLAYAFWPKSDTTMDDATATGNTGAAVVETETGATTDTAAPATDAMEKTE